MRTAPYRSGHRFARVARDAGGKAALGGEQRPEAGGGRALRGPVTVATIRRIVADYYGLPIAVMTQRRGPEHHTFPRQAAMFLAYELLDTTQIAIAADFGVCHNSVQHGISAVSDRIDTIPQRAGEITTLRAIISAHLTELCQMALGMAGEKLK